MKTDLEEFCVFVWEAGWGHGGFSALYLGSFPGKDVLIFLNIYFHNLAVSLTSYQKISLFFYRDL